LVTGPTSSAGSTWSRRSGWISVSSSGTSSVKPAARTAPASLTTTVNGPTGVSRVWCFNIVSSKGVA
jgi:hypothetical protein